MNTVMLMLLGHLVSDYTLQGWLADAKTKDWWHRNASDPKYRHDWVAGLTCHALYWSLLTFLPLYQHPLWWLLVVTQAGIHMVIDHTKCNARMINLWQDQLLHLGQIVVAYLMFTGVP